jgi:hypothetical protein
MSLRFRYNSLFLFALSGVFTAPLSDFAWAQNAQRPAPRPTLRLQLSPEQPSGIYFERDTLRTRTALLFSLRAWNDTSETRPLTLWWRIEDAAGKTWWKTKTTVPVGARNFVLRREAWEAPQLGAYRLRIDAQATGSRKESAQLDWPFAVVSAPRPSYRPRSFFALSSPTFLGENQLDSMRAPVFASCVRRGLFPRRRRCRSPKWLIQVR